jgi:hypothetical protein
MAKSHPPSAVEDQAVLSSTRRTKDASPLATDAGGTNAVAA